VARIAWCDALLGCICWSGFVVDGGCPSYGLDAIGVS
jgi:hypothetical protein